MQTQPKPRPNQRNPVQVSRRSSRDGQPSPDQRSQHPPHPLLPFNATHPKNSALPPTPTHNNPTPAQHFSPAHTPTKTTMTLCLTPAPKQHPHKTTHNSPTLVASMNSSTSSSMTMHPPTPTSAAAWKPCSSRLPAPSPHLPSLKLLCAIGAPTHIKIPNRPPTNNPLPPPLPCPLCQWTPTPTTDPSQTIDTTKAIRTHYRTVHPNADLNALPQSYLQNYKLFHCTTCNTPQFLYLRPNHLRQHTRTCHDPYRDSSNLDIITTTLPPPSPTHTQQWQTALQWLYNLQLRPTPFRTTLRRHLSPQTIKLLHTQFHHITQWLLLSSNPFRPNSTLPPWQKTATPFWKLLFLFEALILHPHKIHRQQTLSATVAYRCQLFRSGQLELLHNAAYQTTTDTQQPTPNTTTRPTTPSDASIRHSAQMAINQDNLQAASARLFSTNPQAALTTKAIQTIQRLYPPRRPYGHTPNTRHNTHTTPTTTTPTLKLDTLHLQTALRRLRRGTATGPYGDSTDFLRSYALHARRLPNGTFTFPYFETTRRLLHLIINATIPTDIHSAFTANYFMALHKDIQQPAKLRPIGIGTALRRLTGAALMHQHRTTLAAYFLPQGQFGVGIKGGIDILLHATSNDVHNLITTPANPQHVLLSLDIKNMFNEVSRDATLTTLRTTPMLQPLLPYYRLLYDAPSTCWYRPHHTTTHATFTQAEGHAQGDPLSGAFSAIPLAMLLQAIRPALIQRQHLRTQPQSSTTPPPIHAPRSYMDDTSIILHRQDLTWFLQQFATQGRKFGIFLNPAKTSILTATDHSPLLDRHDGTACPHLRSAVTFLAPHASDPFPQTTTGLKLLGTPIGSPSFRQAFLHKAADEFQTRTDRLLSLITDAQSCSAMFRTCLQPSLAHLFFTDLTSPAPTTDLPHLADPYHWRSSFIDRVMCTTTHFLRRLTHQSQPLPNTALLVAFHPASAGGAGYRDLAASAIPQTLVAIHRSLQYAQHGIPLIRAPPQPIPPLFVSSLLPPPPTTQLTPDIAPLFHIYRHHQTLLPDPTTLPPPGLTRQLYADYKQAFLTTQLPTLPMSTQVALPSLLTPITSLPLHSLPRFLPSNRIPSTQWRLLLQRKLRLPLTTQMPTTCTCGKPLDPFGDHFFACKKHSKSTLSNKIRDTFHTVLHALAPMANFCRNSTDIQSEPTAILPHHPTKRPADIGFPPLSPSSHSDPSHTSRYIAIDVTIPPAPVSHTTGLPQQLPSNPPIYAAHEASSRRKFIGRTSQIDAALLIADLNANHITLLPFTVDHLGGFGFFLYQFLFGTHPPPCLLSPPPKPPWRHPNDFPHSPAFFAYQRALCAPSALFSVASRTWSQQTRNTHRYGKSQSTSSPTQWGFQTLALNISLALTAHLSSALPAVLPSHPPPPPLPGPDLHNPYSTLTHSMI